MNQIKYRVSLQDFKILVENESSPDEPYLWVFHVRLDSRNLDLFDANKSSVHVYSPAGSHGNLGPRSADVRRTDPPIKIPPKLGRYEAHLEFGKFPFPSMVPLATIGLVIVGLEEDASPTTAKVEEARRALVRAMRTELNGALRKLIREGDFTQDAVNKIRDAIDIDRLRQVITDTVQGQVIRNFVLGFLFPAFWIGADPDDFVGFRIVGPIALPRLLRSIGSSIPIEAVLERKSNFEGRYRVTGKIEVTDPAFHVHLGAAMWRPARLLPGREAARPYRIIAAGRAPITNKVFRTLSEDAGATFGQFRSIGDGLFESGPALAATADGSAIHAFGRGTDKKYYRALSTDQGRTWSLAWAKVADFEYDSPPGLAVSGDGKHLYAIGRWKDQRFYVARSQNGGSSFSSWLKIADGLFKSAPAVATSHDGATVHVFGAGRDWRIWQARSDQYGQEGTWNIAWRPIGDQAMLSAPAAACDRTGNTVIVVARAEDTRLYYKISHNRGSNWTAWNQFKNGSFISSPAVVLSPDGKSVITFGVGNNMGIYYLRSTIGGGGWDGKWTRISDHSVFY